MAKRTSGVPLSSQNAVFLFHFYYSGDCGVYLYYRMRHCTFTWCTKRPIDNSRIPLSHLLEWIIPFSLSPSSTVC